MSKSGSCVTSKNCSYYTNCRLFLEAEADHRTRGHLLNVLQAGENSMKATGNKFVFDISMNILILR